MSASSQFQVIQTFWTEEVKKRLPDTSLSDIEIIANLDQFFDLLIKALDSTNREILDPMILDWVEAHSQVEFEESFISFPPILHTIVESTVEIVREKLEPEQALDLIQTLMPVFTYIYETITKREVWARMEHFTTRMEKYQSDIEKVDQSKSDFIAVAAHELRTPLTLIEGYTSILRESFSKSAPESAELLTINGIYKGTSRLQEIIDDMIDVSMIDNNLLTLNFQPTWLNLLLDVLSKDVRPFVKERNQQLEIKDFEGKKEMFFADSERLHQSLRNLLTNAIKYTPDGGQITVDGKIIDGFIEVSVKDSGIGISVEDQIRIFQKFGQVGEVDTHSSGKTKFKGGGPGLGLPITKGIIEAHGGKIWVESDGYDEKTLPGSKFIILIPLRKEPPDDKVAKLFKQTKE